MDTKTLNIIKLKGNHYDDIINSNYLSELSDAVLEKFIDFLINNLWVKFDGGYYVSKYEMIIGNCAKDVFPIDYYPSEFLGLKTKKLTQEQARELFVKKHEKNPMITDSHTKGSYLKNYIVCKGGCISISSGSFFDWPEGDTDYLKIPSVPMKIYDFFIRVFCREYRLTGGETGVEKIRRAVKIFAERNVDINTATCRDWYDVAKVFNISIEREDIEIELNKMTIKFDGDMLEDYKNQILSADYIRAGIEAYDKKCLTDINLGNWELWSQDTDEDSVSVELETPLVARNPVADIRHDGIVGIDFGTKSTIVSYQDGNDITKLIRIGVGQLSKKAELKHYENPTVMEFIDIRKFIEAYNSQPGRPLTSLEDLTVSHKAANSMHNCENSDFFYSFFYDIKQWCGDNGRYKQIKIIDQNGEERILKPYLEISDGEFDPVEVYAYYLGLFINNMRNGVYLNYVLSFPVSYSRNVREKILKSFSNGIKKSLPTAVLNDEQAMAELKIKQGVSEPAAYAICALKQYGFDPVDDEKIFYGIFDFGGGTTDFDFGIWRNANDSREERRYDYVINHFGAGGDKYLGGENLLELMAYEVFKANSEKLLKGNNENSPGFAFFKPTECDDFPGSEVLIANSQEAKRNTKQLMERLRPFWEGITSYNEQDNSYTLDECCDILENGFIKVDLFDKNGQRHPSFQLDIENSSTGVSIDLYAILEKRIEQGVKNFFEALKLTYKNNSNHDIDKINIFLAGNSSKSPVLLKLFNKYIKEETMNINSNDNSDDNVFFELYPPLGTEHAKEIQKKRNIETDDNDILIPTGKTGVAYGLIEGRSGGTIKIISETSSTDEIKFRYYLGRAKKGKFNVISDRNKGYNEWFPFIDAGNEEFELYYSTLPEVTTNNLDIKKVSKKRCSINVVDECSDVYIRLVAPTVIEYAVAESEDALNNQQYVSEPKKMDLSL